MQSKSVLHLLFLCASLVCLKLVNARSYNNGLIFYDLQTLQPFLPPTISVSRGRGLASVKFSEKGSIWSTFGKPCECRNRVCGCCAGINVRQYNFNQNLCANVTFIPPSEEALLEVFLNGKPSSKYGISVRNPSPFCIPIMMGIPMATCVQLSDITVKGNNLNMCMDFIVRLATTDLFEMHFQCMQMGLDGFQYIDKNGNPVIPPGSSKIQTDDDYYDYDAADDVDAANEINSSAEEAGYDEIDAQLPTKTVDASYIVGLQQQMEQLQDGDQNRKEYHNLVTQINDKATPASIAAEAQTELIAAITAAYGNETLATTSSTAERTESETEPNNGNDPTESETEFPAETEIGPPATTTVNSVNNDAPYNNYGEAPATASTMTTEDAANNPITTAINGLKDVTTNENIVAVNVNTIPLQNVATNYESDALNATDSKIYVEPPSTSVVPATVLATAATISNHPASSEAASTENFSNASTTDSTTASAATGEAPATSPTVGTSPRHLHA